MIRTLTDHSTIRFNDTLVLGLEEFDDLYVLIGVDVGGAEGGEEHELELAILSGEVENVVDSNLITNFRVI